MPTNSPCPTVYPDINLLLEILSSDVQAILGEAFYGLYLYGSLASGDFNPTSSDIDFLVVTRVELPVKQISALETMHLRLAGSGLPWSTKLEGAYMPLGSLRSYKPDAAPHPQLNEGRFYLEREGVDWVFQRHILREHERIVTGPPLRGLIDPVTRSQMCQAGVELLRTWWAALLRDPARLESSEYQAYAILTMCRALYTLQYGALLSKPASARWALDSLAPEWAPLITEALQWRRGQSLNKLEDTLALIHFVLQRSMPSQRLSVAR